jgi:hypothetical protein
MCVLLIADVKSKNGFAKLFVNNTLDMQTYVNFYVSFLN